MLNALSRVWPSPSDQSHFLDEQEVSMSKFLMCEVDITSVFVADSMQTWSV